MKIGCVIMAAGAAQRFGGEKLLQPLAGRPLLSHTLGVVPRDRFERIVTVTRSHDVAALCREAAVPALIYDGGPLSETVRLGIGQMTGLEGCLFLPGDQPLCARRSIETMLAELERHPDCVIRLAYNRIGGSPVLFPASLFRRLSELTGERGGLAAARESGAQILLVEAQNPQELWDVDTPESLSEAEKYLR